MAPGLRLLASRSQLVFGAAVTATAVFSARRRAFHCESTADMNNIFQFKLTDIDGNPITHEELKGKAAILIVNVASE